jgi:hypothetical protein
MNIDKFKRFILKRTNSVDPPCWDLLDKTNSQVIDHIVEDEDQGPGIITQWKNKFRRLVEVKPLNYL